MRPLPWLLLAVAGSVAALLWAPTLALAGVGLQIGGLPALGLLATLVLALLAPQLEVVTAALPRAAVPLALLAAGVALVVAVRAAGGFGPDSPRPTSLLYALDADEGRAVWASFERRPSPWTGEMLPAEPERRSLPEFLGHETEMAIGPAPVLDLEAPEVTVEEAPADGGGGTYRFRVLPPPGAHRLRLQLAPAAAIEAATVAGREAELPADRSEVLELLYLAPPAGGVDVAVEAAPDVTPELGVVAQWFRLPSEPEGGPAARGPGLMQTSLTWDSDTTLVRASFRLAPAAAPPDAAPDPVPPESEIR